MFFLKKLITPFLLPPGLIILIALAAFFGSLMRKKARAAWVCFLIASLLWIFSIAPTAGFLLKGLESGLDIPERPRGDVIIMLGGSVYNGTPDLSGEGSPGPGTMERLVTAARLYRRLNIPILVSGGNVYDGSTAVAPIAARFLVDLGIPPEMVLIESESRDTYENALFSKRLCIRQGLHHPILVTTGFHMKRALYCFESVKLMAAPYPCGLTVKPQQPFSWRRLLPNAASLHAASLALHEWLGRIWYWVRY
jgi:uncharacterized SAM-binding protein YcdF (DUF218 family)